MKHVNVSVNLEKMLVINKQRWNKNRCGCECKELIDKELCDEGLFGILVIVRLNVIKREMVVNI